MRHIWICLLNLSVVNKICKIGPTKEEQNWNNIYFEEKKCITIQSCQYLHYLAWCIQIGSCCTFSIWTLIQGGCDDFFSTPQPVWISAHAEDFSRNEYFPLLPARHRSTDENHPRRSTSFKQVVTYQDPSSTDLNQDPQHSLTQVKMSLLKIQQ